jgi:hypothetical protein
MRPIGEIEKPDHPVMEAPVVQVAGVVRQIGLTRREVFRGGCFLQDRLLVRSAKSGNRGWRS